MMQDMVLFAGTAHPTLARAVARAAGVELGECEVTRFPDGELSVHLLGTVRRKEVFLVQPTSPPVNETLLELLMLADACRRAAASRVTALIPYFGYARSDKRHGYREPITASMVALLLQAVGVDHIVTIDLHAPQLEGFFHVPVDSLTAASTLCTQLMPRLPADTVVVAPDAGAMRMANRYAQRLGTSLVVLHKRRESGTQTEVTHLVGEVRDHACLIVDDMISTGGTIARAVATLLEAGARPEMTVAATHGLLLAGAREKLGHEAVREVVVTDTIPVDTAGWSRLDVVSVAPLLAQVLRRFMMDGSLSDLR